MLIGDRNTRGNPYTLDQMLETPDQPATTPADAAEVEWQLDATDLDAVARWLESAEPHAGLTSRLAGRKLIVDHYVDTADLRLYAAGFAARLRGANGKAEATLKSVVSEGDADSGLRRRLELNEPIRYALLHSLATARGAVGARIRQHAAIRELRVLFTVRTDRRVALLATRDGTDVGEVAIDDTTIEAGDRTASIRRIEVEALQPDVEATLAPWVAHLREVHHLAPGTSSKFGGGLELARATGVIETMIPEPAIPEEMRQAPPAQPAPPAPPAVPPPSPAPIATEPPAAPALEPLPRHSIAALVRDVLTAQLAEVTGNEAGTRLGEDIEALHDMRVGVRRLRTALRLFAKQLPAPPESPGAAEGDPGRDGGIAAIDASLRWLAAELGVVRDLDVQLERIEEWREALEEPDARALDPLAALLRQRRDAARAAMIAALDTPRLPALIAALEAMAAAGRADLPKRALKPATAALPAILEKQHRALRTRVLRIEDDPHPPADLLHETRIRAKRLRYAAEFATPVYGKPARALVSTLKRAQDVLGLHQDAEVAIAELRALAADAGHDLPPETLFAMGEVAQRYRESQGQQRDAFPEVAADVRRRWRRLRRRLRERRGDA